MKKKMIPVIMLALLFSGNMVFAQGNQQHLKVYRNAIQSGDGQMAVTALSYLVAEQPKTTYRDTLAMLYFQSRQPLSALYWVNQRLDEKPANSSILKTLKAQCLAAVGDQKSAITIWEELAQTTDVKAKSGYLWQLANGQYSIKRQLEALSTIEKLELLPADTARTISYNSSKDERVMYTSLPAAAANMKGMLLYDMKKLPEAKEAFTKSVSFDKSYALAQQNISVVEMELAAAAKATAEKEKGAEKDKAVETSTDLLEKKPATADKKP